MNELGTPERPPRKLTIGAPFQVAWQAIRDLFEEMFKLVAINLIWALIGLPLVALAVGVTLNGSPIVGPMVLVVAALLFGPATIGLYGMAERITDGRTVTIGLYFETIRSRWLQSWRVYVPWSIGLALALVNQQFYGELGGLVGPVVATLFLYLSLVWCGVLIYLGPLVVLQEDTRVRTIYRNAILMTLGRPLFTLLTLILMLASLALSVVVLLLLLVVTGSLLALWGMRATKRLIEDADARRAALDPAEPSNASNEKGRGGQIRPR